MQFLQRKNVGLSEQGLRGSLEATMHVKGLLEMMFDVLSSWLDEFISDMEVRYTLIHTHSQPQLCAMLSFFMMVSTQDSTLMGCTTVWHLRL